MAQALTWSRGRGSNPHPKRPLRGTTGAHEGLRVSRSGFPTIQVQPAKVSSRRGKHGRTVPPNPLARLRPTLYLGPCPQRHPLGVLLFSPRSLRRPSRLDLNGTTAEDVFRLHHRAQIEKASRFCEARRATRPNAPCPVSGRDHTLGRLRKDLSRLRSPMNKSKSAGFLRLGKPRSKGQRRRRAVVYQYLFIVSSSSSFAHILRKSKWEA